MKIGGQVVTAPSEEVLVFQRDTGPLVFKARALPDMDEFHKFCPEPQPRKKLVKNEWVIDTEAVGYAEEVAAHIKMRVGYMVTRTLAPSEIEWDTVDLNNPKTWVNWESDLRNAGMTQIEVNKVGTLVMDANSLSEEKLAHARELFLLGRALVQRNSSSPNTAPASSQSGEPAPVSESDPQV